MKNTESLEKLCEIVEKQLDKAVKELENDPGKLPMQDAEYLDKLTHTIKSIKTTLAMEGYGSSERRGRDSMGRYTSRDGGSYDGSYDGSYYDGSRRSYADGSYRSYEGRSMHGDEMREKLERMMRETDDPKVRNALHTAMNNI